MSDTTRFSSLFVRSTAAVVLVAFLAIVGWAAPASAAGTTYYVDCAGGSDSNNGTSPNSAWGTLGKVNSTTFSAGDAILFNRGVTCSGTLWPKGSGSDGSPITIGDYGSGSLPVIDGGSNQAAIKIYNQQYWHIQNIETTGGTIFGIYIAGDIPGFLNHFRVTNVVAHDVYGPVDDKESGLIVITPEAADTFFNDVIIDGATVYNTTQWSGIIVGQDDFGNKVTSPRSTNVTIRNSSVHDVYGDAIVLFQVNNGLIETSVAWNTGQKPNSGVGTPNSIWTWMCGNCIVQFNEGYLSDSPAHDGGVYDIDYGSWDNIIQYNYAHDAQGYCVAVFGIEATGTTTNSIVRYNICSNNARDPKLVDRQGDIFIDVWAGGRLNGVQVYNNTIYWNPAANFPALKQTGTFIADLPNFFNNNIIYSTVPKLIDSNASMTLDHNLYWYTGADDPIWIYNKKTYTSLSAYQAGSGQDIHGLYADPRLNDPTYHGIGMPVTAFTLLNDSPAIDAGMDVGSMGAQDFFGNLIPQGSYDIGANEYPSGAPPSTPLPTDTPQPTPTATDVPLATDTPLPTPTATDVPEATNTPIDTPLPTQTAAATDVPEATNTPADTPLPTLTATATGLPAATDTPAPTATPGGSTVMHVEDIYTTDANGVPKDTFIAGTDDIYYRVQILDQNGNPVSGVSVTCELLFPSGSRWLDQTSITGADGWALFEKATQKSNASGVYTVYVMNVVLDGATYDPNANVKDSHQFTMQ